MVRSVSEVSGWSFSFDVLTESSYALTDKLDESDIASASIERHYDGDWENVALSDVGFGGNEWSDVDANVDWDAQVRRLRLPLSYGKVSKTSRASDVQLVRDITAYAKDMIQQQQLYEKRAQ